MHYDVQPFLDTAGWSGAEREVLAGDGSGRVYERLKLNNKYAVLMVSPNESTQSFIYIANHLKQLGYSVPDIYAVNCSGNLLLLEDFGDKRLLEIVEDPETNDHQIIYETAIDLLVDLGQQRSPAELGFMDTKYLEAENCLFIEWGPLSIGGIQDISKQLKSWINMWRKVYTKAPIIPCGLSLRDFHSGNLMWLPSRSKFRKLGLLDFQDAIVAPISYDLVSLLQDVRIELAVDFQTKMISRFLNRSADLNEDDFLTSYAILGTHRNLRIIAVFMRLAIMDGKTDYLKFLPRVWKLIDANLEHPALKPVKTWLDNNILKEMRIVTGYE